MSWEQQLNEIKQAGHSSVQIIHGNIRDKVRLTANSSEEPTKKESWGDIRKYLNQVVFADRSYCVTYDPSSGIDFPDKEHKREFLRTLEAYDKLHGTNYAQSPPRAPAHAFLMLENYLRLKAYDGKSALCVIDYCEEIIPVSDNNSSAETRFCYVSIDKWASDPQFQTQPITFVLLVSQIGFIDAKIARNPSIPKVEMLLPDLEDRQLYLNFLEKDFTGICEMPMATLAKMTQGLSLGGLERILIEARSNRKKISLEDVSENKRKQISAECQGLLELVEPNYTLEMVAGHTAARAKLTDAVWALKAGHLEHLPMGYLICGPVGTGKSFLVNCFAGECGIPVVTFLNFRSQWVGATEANLDKIINLIKSMPPVVVVIDEADAFLGSRSSSGDSGTSSRIFARLVSFMGDTRYRGKIIWFLITSRPDLLPVDVKRQGRAEEHIPLFYPEQAVEKIQFFTAIAQKLKIELDLDEKKIPEIFKQHKAFSGAEVEGVLNRAKFLALKNNSKVDEKILAAVAQDFIPPAYPREIKYQTLVAVRECTSRAMLPSLYAKMDAETLEQEITNLS